MKRNAFSSFGLFLLLVMSSCEHNYPQHLSNEVTLVAAVPCHPLGLEDIAMLAVINNPGLNCAREARGLGGPQAFISGLLPHPQFGATHDCSFVAPGSLISYNVDVTLEPHSLTLLPGNTISAEINCVQVSLDILWKEQQIITQAALLYTRVVTMQRQLAFLQESARLLERQYDLNRCGDMSSDIVLTQKAVMKDLRSRIRDFVINLDITRKNFNDLLGLGPDIQLCLVEPVDPHPLDARAITQSLPKLLPLRADLWVLNAGYESQEESVWQAIFAQFPPLTLHSTQTQNPDEEPTGETVTVSLPLFELNNERTPPTVVTRKDLFDEYQTRLDSSYKNIKMLLNQDAKLTKKLADIEASIAELSEASNHAEFPFQEGLFKSTAYLKLKQSLFKNHVERQDTLQAIMEGRLALQALLGQPFICEDRAPCE